MQTLNSVENVAESKVQRPQALDALTASRFFAAMCIVICHTEGMKLTRYFPDQRSSYSLSHCLEFFFALSGFVLFYNYAKIKGPRALKDYFINRVTRIFPLYYLTGFVCMFVPGLNPLGDNPLAPIAVYLLSLQDWFKTNNLLYCLNPAAHSISCEVFYYLVFPFLVMLGGRKTVLAVAGLLAAVVFSYSPLIFPEPYSAFPLRSSMFFLTGMLFAKLFAALKPIQNKFLMRPSLVRTLLFTLLEIGLLTLVCDLSWSITCVYGIAWAPKLAPNLAVFLLSLCFSSIILLFALEQGALAKVLKHKFLVKLGHSSYALFLIHYPLLLVVCHQLNWQMTKVNPAFIICWMSFMIALSLPLHEHVENPCRAYLARYLSGSGSISLGSVTKQYVLRFGIPLMLVFVAAQLIEPVRSVYAACTSPSTQAQFDAIAGEVVSGSENMRFGDLMLLSAKVQVVNKPSGKETTFYTLWSDERGTFKEGYQITHLVDTKGLIIKNLDHPLYKRTLPFSSLWIESVVLPEAELAKPGVQAIALAVCLDTRCILFPIKGQSGQKLEIIGGRLMLPIKPLPVSGSSAK